MINILVYTVNVSIKNAKQLSVAEVALSVRSLGEGLVRVPWLDVLEPSPRKNEIKALKARD